MMTIQLTAHIFSVLTFMVIAFQIALALGAPWGHLTWGGKFTGQLPKKMRGVAIFSAVLLAVFVVIVETRAGFLFPAWQSPSNILIWFVVGYCALGVIANAITPSRWERIIWLPVVLMMLICSFLVAIN
jgi:hypothetical protein